MAAAMTAGSLPLPVLAGLPPLPRPRRSHHRRTGAGGRRPLRLQLQATGPQRSMNLHGVDATDSVGFDVPVSWWPPAP
jgi:hypothetical protein